MTNGTKKKDEGYPLNHPNMLSDMGVSDEQWREILEKTKSFRERKLTSRRNSNFITFFIDNEGVVRSLEGEGVCHGSVSSTFILDDYSIKPLVTFTVVLPAESLTGFPYTATPEDFPYDKGQLARYFGWLASDSPYADAFVKMDAEWMVNYGTFSRLDVDSRLTLASFMFTRYAHEFRDIIHVWDTLVSQGGYDPGQSFVLAHLIRQTEGPFKGDLHKPTFWTSRGSTGHNGIYASALSKEWIRNYLRRKIVGKKDSVQNLRSISVGAYKMFIKEGSSVTSVFYKNLYTVHTMVNSLTPEEAKQLNIKREAGHGSLENPFKSSFLEAEAVNNTVNLSLSQMWFVWSKFFERVIEPSVENTKAA